jgi:large subunit ribosomal protein L23
MTMSPYYIIRRPLLSEESTIQNERIPNQRKYVFRVDPKANKRQIRDAVEQMFSVHVAYVHTMNYGGKRAGRRGRGVPGYRPDWKKAIVTLHEGDEIDLV